MLLLRWNKRLRYLTKTEIVVHENAVNVVDDLGMMGGRHQITGMLAIHDTTHDAQISNALQAAR